MTEIEYRTRETMRATQAPDVYGGADCAQHNPRWIGSAEGDMDGDGPVGVDGVLMLNAKTFPPGTRVTVREPECPHCHMVPSWTDGRWECECSFDWRAFAEDKFS